MDGEGLLAGWEGGWRGGVDLTLSSRTSKTPRCAGVGGGGGNRGFKQYFDEVFHLLLMHSFVHKLRDAAHAVRIARVHTLLLILYITTFLLQRR